VRLIAACIIVSVWAAPAFAQKYVSTEVTAGGVVLNATSPDPGWFVDAMKMVLPKVGFVAEVVEYYDSSRAVKPGGLLIASGGIRGRFRKEGPNGYVQVLFGHTLTYNGGDTAILKPGVGVTFPLNPQWAIRARADLHIEGEGAGAVFGVGLTRQWGAK